VRDIDLFQQALGLERPWVVRKVEFSAEERRLDLHVDFERGGRFECPECSRGDCTAYDTTEKTWRHLNFFQHQAFLHARLPRVECPEHGVKQVEVPWARRGSGFTLLFEALVLTLAKQMSVKAVADLVGEHDTRIWRIVHHHVDEARAEADFSDARRVGVDETSSKRGQDYITLFMDLDRSRLLYATEGREGETFGRFRLDLMAHGGHPEQIEELAMDMSAAYQKGAAQHFPLAEITFDKFHVMKLLNDAVDQVRREEQKERPELKKTRYLWMKNRAKLTNKQEAELDALTPKKVGLRTARAYQLKVAFQEFWPLPDSLARDYWKKWYYWATHSRLQPMIRVAKTLKKHEEGLFAWFRSRITNAMLEAMSSLIQAAKARARGYRNSRNLIAISYLIGGKLPFKLPI
jgi:transposase